MRCESREESFTIRCQLHLWKLQWHIFSANTYQPESNGMRPIVLIPNAEKCLYIESSCLRNFDSWLVKITQKRRICENASHLCPVAFILFHFLWQGECFQHYYCASDAVEERSGGSWNLVHPLTLCIWECLIARFRSLISERPGRNALVVAEVLISPPVVFVLIKLALFPISDARLKSFYVCYVLFGLFLEKELSK
jgi:hypothetical protein